MDGGRTTNLRRGVCYERFTKTPVVEEEGQGITEYALILGLIVFGVWVLIQSTEIGQSISTLFTNVKGQIDECSSDAGSCGGGGPTP